MEISEMVSELRNVIGDNDPNEPNIIDTELIQILKNATKEYSRIKGVLKVFETPYDKNEEFYDIPEDSYKVKKVILKEYPYYKINFIDNLNQIILEELPDVNSGTLRITYSRYFSPDEVDEREIDLLMLFAEALCYKLMASKTAELIKFSTGEKMVDESPISQKYLELFEMTAKNFRRKAIKAYGKRKDNVLENINFDLPWPSEGETP